VAVTRYLPEFGMPYLRSEREKRVTRAEKERLVEEMSSAFKESEAVVVCDYRGLTCQGA